MNPIIRCYSNRAIHLWSSSDAEIWNRFPGIGFFGAIIIARCPHLFISSITDNQALKVHEVRLFIPLILHFPLLSGYSNC